VCSTPASGAEAATTGAELTDIILRFQVRQCHKVHWVTPTHQLPWLLEALEIARGRGLTMPLVYNTGGCETMETLRSLERVVDIYLPDFKIWDDALAWKYLRVRNYPEVTRQALVEMKRQVGDLVLDDQG